MVDTLNENAHSLSDSIIIYMYYICSGFHYITNFFLKNLAYYVMLYMNNNNKKKNKKKKKYIYIYIYIYI